ncbi:SusC/RagA family TonB-linked outer membrane protein [Proteiniphilum sp. X52]|nr:TonB-dependent receptor [Proteiniphilum sp. X52]RNC63977.1 SusC/RagA family TonB-linked outer membrane protein [Proteiniphilum sp. X52]
MCMPIGMFAQTGKKLDLALKEKTLKEFFQTIESKTEYTFMYSNVDLDQKVSIEVNQTSLDNILKSVLTPMSLTYEVRNRQILIKNLIEKVQSMPADGPSTKSITGTVLDQNNEPVIGANIIEKGTSNGTVTDIDGNFSLQVKSDAVLLVSYIGYLTQYVNTAGRGNFTIVLQEDTRSLEELVVIGYGTMRRADITTAVSVVSTEDIDKRPLMSAAQALQGKAAGVQVVQPSGEPGAGMTIRVRGATSVQASNEPLYVVDGMPTDNISNISPNDIESMQILKDASSAAIYGARAANGVVLITTKRGRVGETRVRLNAYTGFSRLGKKINALDTEQYKELMKDLKKQGSIAAPTIPDDEYRYSDWTDRFFETGINQNYQVSVSKGSEKIQYAVSGGFSDEKGIVGKSKFNRYNFRANIDSQQTDWLHVALNFSYSKTKGQWVRSNASSLRSGSILSVINTPPFMQEWDPDNPGQYDETAYGARIMNPLAANAADNVTATDFLKGSLAFTFDLYRGLKLKSTFGTDIYNEQWNYYLDPLSTSDGRATKGRVEESFSKNNEWLIENILTYDRSFNKHNLSLMGGATQQHAQADGLYLAAFDMAVGYPHLHSINAANQIDKDAASSPASAWSLASFLGRLAYNYDSKYLLTVNFRSDGSSRFAPGYRWGYFPSLSAGWRVSSEEFMKPLQPLVDDMKIRVGYGKNGNQGGIGNYAYLAGLGASRVVPTTDNQYPGQAIWKSRAANTELTWEKTSQWNAGLDMTLLGSRLNITIDAYHKKTTDLLLDVTLPANISNLSGNFTRNDGEMINRGVEFLVSSKNLTGEFGWDTDLNISFNRNKVTRLGLAKVYYYAPTYGTEEHAVILKEGLELGSFFGYISEGVDPETGDIIYRDISGNGSVGPEDRTVIGSAQPDFIYGMTNTFSYKNVSLSLFLQGSQGNQIFNASKIDTEGMMDFRNQSVKVIDRWRRPGMVTDIPRPGNAENIHNSSRFVEDGSYLRVKNITLSYDFMPSLLKKIHLSRLQVYATAQNLFTLTRYSGYDPEVNAYGGHAVAMGVDYGTYPQSKAVVFGFNMEF